MYSLVCLGLHSLLEIQITLVVNPGKGSATYSNRYVHSDHIVRKVGKSVTAQVFLKKGARQKLVRGHRHVLLCQHCSQKHTGAWQCDFFPPKTTLCRVSREGSFIISIWYCLKAEAWIRYLSILFRNVLSWEQIKEQAKTYVQRRTMTQNKLST